MFMPIYFVEYIYTPLSCQKALRSFLKPLFTFDLATLEAYTANLASRFPLVEVLKT